MFVVVIYLMFLSYRSCFGGVGSGTHRFRSALLCEVSFLGLLSKCIHLTTTTVLTKVLYCGHIQHIGVYLLPLDAHS